MLVLSRKTPEKIVIDGNIRVVVVAISGDRVKLGIEAPQNIPVHRAEVQQRIRQESCHGIQEVKWNASQQRSP
jgi:carbon storage regulator